jgi:hypothetical protein
MKKIETKTRTRMGSCKVSNRRKDINNLFNRKINPLLIVCKINLIVFVKFIPMTELGIKHSAAQGQLQPYAD